MINIMNQKISNLVQSTGAAKRTKILYLKSLRDLGLLCEPVDLCREA